MTALSAATIWSMGCKRGLAGLAVLLLVVAVGAWFAQPFDDPAGLPATSMSIDRPVVVSRQPLVVIESGTLHFEGARGWSLVSSAYAATAKTLRVDGARIVIGGEAEPAGTTIGTLAARLVAEQVDSLAIANGTLVFRTSPTRSIVLPRFEGAFELDETVSGQGSFELLGSPVAYRLSVSRGGKDATLDLTLSGSNVAANFSGLMSLGPSPSANGRLSLELADARQVGSALGLSLPGTQGLRRLAASGQLDVAAGFVSLEEARITVDNNEAVGRVSMDLAGERPRLDGTLAFGVLDLAAYVGDVGVMPSSRDTVSEAWKSVRIDLPLLGAIDSDLRLSANAVTVGPLRTGPAAATVSLQAGAVSANIAELNLEGGTVTATFSYRPQQKPSRTSVQATITRLPLAAALAQLAQPPRLAGSADAQISIGAYGDTLGNILDTMSGTIDVSIENGGMLPVSMDALAGHVEGIRDAFDAVGTDGAFKRLAASFIVKDGVATTRSFEIETPDRALQAAGVVDVANQRVQLQFRAGVHADISAPAAADVTMIAGPWSALKLSREPVLQQWLGDWLAPAPALPTDSLNGPG